MHSDQLHHKKKARKTKEKRNSYNRKSNPHIFILCEGTKTEPNYFTALKEDLRLISVEIKGCGVTPKNILAKAKAEMKKYDEIWCVFDRDNFEKVNFNAAFQISKANPKIKIAYTNEAFELWYLLHFDYYDSGIHRSQYEKKLTGELKFTYKKNSEDMYERLLDRQQVAIRRAERLYESYEIHNPEQDNPSTTVHLLVKRLNDLACNV